MTTNQRPERDLEFEAEIRELAKSFLPDPPPPPPPKPNLTVISEGELSSDTLRKRIERDQRLLAAAEKREAEKLEERLDEQRRKEFEEDPVRAALLIQRRQMIEWSARPHRRGERGED
jgi:hypothetical protein